LASEHRDDESRHPFLGVPPVPDRVDDPSSEPDAPARSGRQGHPESRHKHAREDEGEVLEGVLMRPLSVVELRMLVRVHFGVFYPEAPPQLSNPHDLEEVEKDSTGAHEDDVAVL